MCFPCNQFLNQEPKQPTPDLTKKLSTGSLNDAVVAGDNPRLFMMEMVDVNGVNTHPVFEFLKYNSNLYNEKTNLLMNIKWNFGTKFLVDQCGGVYKTYNGPGSTLEEIGEGVKAVLDGACSKATRKPTMPGPTSA
mmetsp:Transcript_88249/g.248433  ORF Transcript_88249/g.248433 Transcript_88249/m.248433 type:complete len:136 (-) Transcript_88249:196-603(-)|eukprot:CAMPEP_0117572332 /NCGR_PEP_ID=MMETSP0784-20121206/60295_1 /TAXON_ID=39447 /ORGANISM="" /LENGTH=135 /DNA_ID=CAMNT_0005370685 /DNA_START=184 /DNA_END=591 /DNA_ORIENTATION=-